MASRLRIGMTREMLNPNGELPDHIAELPLLADSRVDFSPLARLENVMTGDLLRDYDACLAGFALFNHETSRGVERLCCISRWGVGYDNINPQACTDNDVVLITTRGALDYPVAESAMAFILALSHRMLLHDR